MFLHGVSDGFVVELVGGFESKKIFFKKHWRKEYRCVVAVVKEYICFGEGTRAKELMCVCKN